MGVVDPSNPDGTIDWPDGHELIKSLDLYLASPYQHLIDYAIVISPPFIGPKNKWQETVDNYIVPHLQRGEPLRLKLLDFGLAKRLHVPQQLARRLGRESCTVAPWPGTYFPPEQDQARKDQDASHRSEADD